MPGKKKENSKEMHSFLVLHNAHVREGNKSLRWRAFNWVLEINSVSGFRMLITDTMISLEPCTENDKLIYLVG